MPFKHVEFMTQLTTPDPVRLDDSCQEPDILSGYRENTLFLFFHDNWDAAASKLKRKS
jgi:hypothetical protein